MLAQHRLAFPGQAVTAETGMLQASQPIEHS